MKHSSSGTSACTLFLRSSDDRTGVGALLERAGITSRPIRDLIADPSAFDHSAVVLADGDLARTPEELERLPAHAVLVAVDADAEASLGDRADLSFADIESERGRFTALRTAFRLSAEKLICARATHDLARSREELKELNRIGTALMTQHDRHALVRHILEDAIDLTTSDLGVGFLVVTEPDGTRLLQFRQQICRSVDLPDYRWSMLPIDENSLAGHAALTGQTLVHDDIHLLPHDAPYRAHVIATHQPGYWIRSMLTIPMMNQDDEVIGVMVLANRKRDATARITNESDADRWVAPYSENDVELGESLAGQAAIAIENVKLLEEIERLFESFVKASVVAIDLRDPSTAGHSIRVAALTRELADALERTDTAPYSDLRFTEPQIRELHYAALLHDFGKIGVREEVLVKARKLPLSLSERVEARFELIRCAIELDHERERATLMCNGADRRKLDAMDARFHEQIAQVGRIHAIVRAADKPTILPSDVNDQLLGIGEQAYTTSDGRRLPYLMPEELAYLQVAYGSLDENERNEVRMHAALTFDYLSRIPWREGFRDIPRIAAAHHEKLDGSGYPHHLSGPQIPVQTRIITVADIFDALTASDRPYKRAVPPDAALDILRSESDDGLLDKAIVNVMIESHVYRRILEEDWRKLAEAGSWLQ